MYYISYWVLPLVSAFTWLGMLLAMLITWEVEGHPRYASMEKGQNIAYISDIGAQGLKPLFIAGSCVTTVFLDLSFASERWLRHKGRLAQNLDVIEKVLSGLSIVFAIAGTCGLILLSVFDTLHHPHLHDGFLLLFIAGYVISAIFICWEYQRLGVHFRQHRVLRISFWLKLAFILIEVALAIVFAATNFEKKKNVAAVFEWVIALVFTFYVLTFFIDLLPAVRSKHRPIQRAQMEMGINPDSALPPDGAFTNEQLDSDSRYGLTNDRYYANGNTNGNAAYANGAPNAAYHMSDVPSSRPTTTTTTGQNF